MQNLLLLLLCCCSPAILGQDDAWIPETNGIPLHNIDYIADFDSTRQLPFWVAYELLPEETMGEAKRKSSFKRGAEKSELLLRLERETEDASYPNMMRI